MNSLKKLLGALGVTVLLLAPLHSAQAWNNGDRGYQRGPAWGYYGDRGRHYSHDRGRYHRYHRHHHRHDRGWGPAGAVITGLALGAIVGNAIVYSAPPPPSLPPPPGW